MVILAGGLATRLGKLTKTTPKSMILVNNIPFLEYQLRFLKENEIEDIVLCVGHLCEQIVDYFGNGHHLGVDITYSIESHPLGTAGAIKNASPFLNDIFFTIYGDSHLFLDFRKMYDYFVQNNQRGMMTVFKNNDLYDKSNTAFDGAMVTRYDKVDRSGLSYIDYGANIFRKEILKLIPEDTFYSLESLFQQLIQQDSLMGYEVKQRFFEIGSPQGLDDFTAFIAGNTGGRK